MSSPAAALDKLFVQVSSEKLEQLRGRIDDCLGRLSNEQVWARDHASNNSIGNLVLHLCGNVSQWILSGVGGRRYARDRDGEFAAQGGPTTTELRHGSRRRWTKRFQCCSL